MHPIDAVNISILQIRTLRLRLRNLPKDMGLVNNRGRVWTQRAEVLLGIQT